MTEDEMYEQSVHGQLQAARNEIAQLRAQLSGIGMQEFRRLEAENERLRAHRFDPAAVDALLTLIEEAHVRKWTALNQAAQRVRKSERE